MDSLTFFGIPYNTACAFEVKAPSGTTLLYGTVIDKTMNLWNSGGRTIILDNGSIIKVEDVVNIEVDEPQEARQAA